MLSKVSKAGANIILFAKNKQIQPTLIVLFHFVFDGNIVFKINLNFQIG